VPWHRSKVVARGVGASVKAEVPRDTILAGAFDGYILGLASLFSDLILDDFFQSVATAKKIEPDTFFAFKMYFT